MRREVVLSVFSRVMIVSVCIAVFCGTAAAELKFSEGRWRIEMGTFATFATSADDDFGDAYMTGSVEYEFPAFPHGKLGLKLMPLFVTSDEDPVLAGGPGLTARIYSRKDTYDGIFGEVGISALWESREFDGNGSRINFLSEAGLGYKFRDADWHVTLKVQHLSNANLDKDNTGVNGIGLAAGYTF
jgi:lipid A 3-O-deacylase